jgi:hypothetical protein
MTARQGDSAGIITNNAVTHSKPMTALFQPKTPPALKPKINSFLIFCDAFVAQAQKLRYLSKLEVKSPRILVFF